MAEPNDGFAKSVDAIRAIARWTLAAFAAVGTVLVAGSQVSGIGRFAIAVESAGEVSIADLAREETEPKSAAAAFLRENGALLGGFASIRSLEDAYRAAIRFRHDAVLTGSQEEIDLAQQWVMYLGDVVIFPLLSAARYHRVRRTFDRWAKWIVVAGVAAGLGVGAFAWAANPSS